MLLCAVGISKRLSMFESPQIIKILKDVIFRRRDHEKL